MDIKIKSFPGISAKVNPDVVKAKRMRSNWIIIKMFYGPNVHAQYYDLNDNIMSGDFKLKDVLEMQAIYPTNI